MKIEEKIIHAIENHETLLIKMKYGLGNELEVEFDPYIYGSDIMQYGFIWGFLPWNRLYYKLMVDFIISIEKTNKKFELNTKAMYINSSEEEFYASLKEMYEPQVRVFSQGYVENSNE
jgi:hypothetical protein